LGSLGREGAGMDRDNHFAREVASRSAGIPAESMLCDTDVGRFETLPVAA